MPGTVGRALPVRQADRRRRHVRAGLHALPDLQRADDRCLEGLLPDDHELAAHGRVGRGGEEGARGDGRARYGILGLCLRRRCKLAVAAAAV